MMEAIRQFLYANFDIETVKTILFYTEIVFVLYLIGYSTFLFSSVIAGGNELFENIKRKTLHNVIKHDYYVPISIVVPAFNEEITILETIKSLEKLNYKIYEIVVVNDGSKDDTVKVILDKYDLKRVDRPVRKLIDCENIINVYEGIGLNNTPIVLVDKENGGKADAINTGINVSKYPYFVCMDADSILEKDSLAKLAVPILEDKDTIAVGSVIRISNDSEFKDGELVEQRMPRRIVPALQVLEYERSFLASRILLDRWNSNLIISGAFGLFKKDAVVAVGGYKKNSMGEDMELIVKLHSYYRSNKENYRIKYAYESVCWTQAPERLVDLLKQRKRWYIGLFQSIMGHTSLITKPSYIYFVLYELLSPFIEVFGLFVTLLAYVFELLNLKFMIIFYVTYALFCSLLTVISYITRNYLGDKPVRKRDVLKAMLLCIPENVVFRFLLAWERMLALLFYRGKRTNWGKIKRYKINYDNEQSETENINI